MSSIEAISKENYLQSDYILILDALYSLHYPYSTRFFSLTNNIFRYFLYGSTTSISFNPPKY